MDELQKFMNLGDEIRKLPEYGDPLLRDAIRLQSDAKRIIADLIKLEAGFDELRMEIHELWSPEERNGTIF
jgi:hypothetical protein